MTALETVAWLGEIFEGVSGSGPGIPGLVLTFSAELLDSSAKT